MRDENSKKSKLSVKTLVRKWFNIKSKPYDFHADDVGSRGEGEFRTSFTPRDSSCTVKKSITEKLSRKNSKSDFDPAQVIDIQDYKIFVATWNVGGKSPPKNLNLEELLHSSPAADVYVLGFQEIVPLNAGNVLGTEDDGPAKKWLWLIRKTLNSLPGTSCYESYCTPSPIADPVAELDADFEGSSTRQKASSYFHRRSFHSISQSLRMNRDTVLPQGRFDRRFSVCERMSFQSRPSDFDGNFGCGGSSDDENDNGESPSTSYAIPMFYGNVAPSYREDSNKGLENSRYCLVASKQMVGIFLTVWVRNEIRNDVKNLKVSCVGRGLMGYLGNKGSISISMSLHQTSFCFICSHLTSGEKDGDELRRNADVMEILRKTRFPKVQGLGHDKSPETILDHDRVIWLGDLNYRIALSYHSAKALVEMHNWRMLLEKDQLRIEQRRGRVFQGWKEGKIYFPPTYKYSYNSDRYAGDDMNPKEKRRTPAWCDRILYCSRGLSQLAYVRAETRFSDHRPVYGIFSAEVETMTFRRNRKSMSCSSSRVEVEELLPYSHRYMEHYLY